MELPGITQTGPLLVLSLETEPERTALCDGMISSCMIISVIMHILLFVRFKENPAGTVHHTNKSFCLKMRGLFM
jgi:hypothetical protein